MCEIVKDSKKTQEVRWTNNFGYQRYKSFYMHAPHIIRKKSQTDGENAKKTQSKYERDVRNKILKWLDSCIILFFSNSIWISSMHIVPKKDEKTVVMGKNDKMIPSQFMNWWRVCIDYRKLNVVTRKITFPYLFLTNYLSE